MPIYEFYCRDCHTIFNFLSRTVNPGGRPRCPRCRNDTLQREVSVFAAPRHAGEGEAAAGGPDDLAVDERKMEGAMEALAREADGLDENDPREAARLMRKIGDMTGVRMGPSMEEALNRLEAGEDPEQIEADLGDRMENEEPFLDAEAQKAPARKQRPPRRDPTLYEM
jgi:putative FmdB family regulatory protein